MIKTKRIPQLQNFNRQYSKNFIFVYLYKNHRMLFLNWLRNTFVNQKKIKNTCTQIYYFTNIEIIFQDWNSPQKYYISKQSRAKSKTMVKRISLLLAGPCSTSKIGENCSLTETMWLGAKEWSVFVRCTVSTIESLAPVREHRGDKRKQEI